MDEALFKKQLDKLKAIPHSFAIQISLGNCLYM